MKNKKTSVIAAVIIVLAVAMGIFAWLNAGNLADKKTSQQDATVKIVQKGKVVQIDLKYLKSLKKTDFSANIKKNGAAAVKTDFTGVPLDTVLKAKGFNLDSAAQVVFSAADGYVTEVSSKEAEDPDNVYLVYERNGKPSGTRADGGTGPVETVVRKDQFSQRFCKYLMEIDIK